MIHKHPFFGQGPLRHGRRGYHHGRLKDALIEAARILIAEHGPAGFTLAEAAKRVGVTGAAPYRHFADRNELISALARRGFELFGESLAVAWGDGRPDARAALKRMGRAYLTFAAAEPGLYAAMFSDVTQLRRPASCTPPADTAFEGLARAAAAVLAEADVGAADIRRFALELWALAHGTAMLAVAGHLDPSRGDDPGAILDRGAEALIERALKQANA